MSGSGGGRGRGADLPTYRWRRANLFGQEQAQTAAVASRTGATTGVEESDAPWSWPSTEGLAGGTSDEAAQASGNRTTDGVEDADAGWVEGTTGSRPSSVLGSGDAYDSRQSQTQSPPAISTPTALTPSGTSQPAMTISIRVASRWRCPAATIPKTVPATRKPSVCRLMTPSGRNLASAIAPCQRVASNGSAW
jgi:hypothetical protein